MKYEITLPKKLNLNSTKYPDLTPIHSNTEQRTEEKKHNIPWENKGKIQTEEN